MTIALLDALDGTPTLARCQECGASWTRPAGDPHADSLIDFGLDHKHGPDVVGAYLDAGWTVDAAGAWHPPAGGDAA